MNDYLYDVITELLHVEEGQTNKLIDLEARDISKTYYLPFLAPYLLRACLRLFTPAASNVPRIT